MTAIYLLLLVWFQFALVTINYRAIAQGRYLAAGVTDFVIAICGFTLFKLIAAAEGPLDILGYALGAVKGGLTGIWMTRKWGTA
jgi:hypothetical protein